MAEIKDFARMCKAHVDCEGCPFEKVGACSRFMCKYTDEADRIITDWCKEHPQKTYAQDFLEKFPNAAVYANGTPQVCRYKVYGNSDCHNHCSECWKEVIPNA